MTVAGSAAARPERPFVVVVCLDSFKGSLDAAAASVAVASGVRRALPDAEVLEHPMADGGEGTLDALLAAWGTAPRDVVTTDPLGRATTARWGLSADGSTAVVELAEASGLPSVADLPPAPLDATTFGSGVVLRAAVDAGAQEVVLCLGGSATTDGGTGLLTALGARVLDASGVAVAPGGRGLTDVHSVDLSGLDPRARSMRWRLACDVTNPLLGPRGAAAVFGPQKGAGVDDVATLEAGLARWASVLVSAGGTDVASSPGVGAAGGVPAPLVALLDARIEPGAALVAQASGLLLALGRADLVLTGEGRLDGQSLHGKVVGAVAELAAGSPAPVVVLAGSVDRADPGPAELAAAGVTAAFSIAPGPAALADLVDDAGPLLEGLAAHVVRLWSGHRSSETPESRASAVERHGGDE